MIKVKYVLIVRDEQDAQLGVVSTGREPLTQCHKSKIEPKFHTFLLSAFGLYPTAVLIEVVAYEAGKKVDDMLAVVAANKTDIRRTLAYSFPNTEEVEEVRA